MIHFLLILKNLVFPREAGSPMGHACPALRESETIGYASKLFDGNNGIME